MLTQPHNKKPLSREPVSFAHRRLGTTHSSEPRIHIVEELVGDQSQECLAPPDPAAPAQRRAILITASFEDGRLRRVRGPTAPSTPSRIEIRQTRILWPVPCPCNTPRTGTYRACRTRREGTRPCREPRPAATDPEGSSRGLQ